MFVTLGLAWLSLFVFNLLVSGLLLYLVARLFRVEGARFSRALLVVAFSALAHVIAWVGTLSVSIKGWTGMTVPEPFANWGPPAVMGLASLLVSLLATLGLLGSRESGTGKLLVVWLLWGLLANVYGTGVYFAVRTQAEAFIVPTGAMADTIQGHSREVRCPECGHFFRVNASMEQEPAADALPNVRLTGAICPNCRLNISFPPAGGPPASDPERILVVKSLLQSVTVGPAARCDVIVFQYPPQPFERLPSPVKYVKRLVGRGGDTIGIHYGDLYLLEGEQPDPADAELSEDERRQPERMRIDARKELLESRKGEPRFQILRRHPDRVLAMRHLVCDHDAPPQDLEGKSQPRWAGREDRGAWKADGGGFKHTANGDDLAWLGYRHILRTGQDNKPQLITDFVGYNAYETDLLIGSANGKNWVGDLILDFDVRVDSGSGELVIELARGVDRFRARFDLSSGTCTLLRLSGDREEELDRKPTAVKGSGGWHLRFANVDDRLTLWVDGSLPFGEGVTYEAAKPGPTPNDLKPASIGVRGAAMQVNSLKLWRDTYYTVEPGSPDVGHNGPEWDDPETWEPLQRLPARTFYVQPGHCFCLGDNSSQSSDSRSWGLVPERLVLGKAVMVYYPFSRLRLIE